MAWGSVCDPGLVEFPFRTGINLDIGTTGFDSDQFICIASTNDSLPYLLTQANVRTSKKPYPLQIQDQIEGPLFTE